MIKEMGGGWKKKIIDWGKDGIREREEIGLKSGGRERQTRNLRGIEVEKERGREGGNKD